MGGRECHEGRRVEVADNPIYTQPGIKDLYVPSTIQLGGQRTSHSQLRVWNTCRQEWFLSYLAPHPDVEDSTGLTVQYTSSPLATGSHFHAGMAAYLNSGWKDGEDTGQRDIGAAIDHIEKVGREGASEMESPEEAEQAVEVAKKVLFKFDELAPQYEDIRVVGDGKGNPVLERGFEIPLGPDGEFTYVDKIDALVMDSGGYQYVGEWKTTTYRFAHQAVGGVSVQGQNIGHMAVLTTLFPTSPIGGVFSRIFVKDRAAARGKSEQKPYVYENKVIIPGGNVETYLKNVEEWLTEIVDLIDGWKCIMASGHGDAYQAALLAFPQDGLSNGMCQRYGRLCDYAGYCPNHELGARALKGFRPKLVGGEPYQEPREEIE